MKAFMRAVQNTWCPQGLFSAKSPGGTKVGTVYVYKKEQLVWNKFGAAIREKGGGDFNGFLFFLFFKEQGKIQNKLGRK